VIYNVDSIVHGTNDNNNDDSVYYYHFQIKEVIDTPFTDLQGRERQVVIRYYRPDTSQAWTIRNVWSQWLSSQYAYRYEDNIAYHKMSFPISNQINWNYNDMNTLDEIVFEFNDIHHSGTYNSFSFDSTVTIILKDWEDYDNPVERIYEEEVYAAGVGVVFKRSDDLRKNVGVVVSGTEYQQVVAGYGIE
jgi:hypothetical protein